MARILQLCRLVNPLVAPDYLTQDYHSQTPYTYLMRVAPLTAGLAVVILGQIIGRDQRVNQPILQLHRQLIFIMHNSRPII
jgi:hypothetical protein